MNYNLANHKSTAPISIWSGGKSLLQYLGGDQWRLILALLMVLVNSAIAIATPYFIGLATDSYIIAGDAVGLVSIISILACLYAISLVTNYAQMRLMGQVSQQMLYRLRNTIFLKLQHLPLAFFQQNKAGDLTSRLNNDTDKLNQFLSESIMRFVGSFFVILGIAIFVLFFQFTLGLVMLGSTLIIVAISRLLKKSVATANQRSAAAVGALSGQIQESLSNFKVIVAFNRRQYFEEKLQNFNEENFKTNMHSGFINGVYKPLYDSASYMAQALILVVGLYLIQSGQVTIGILIAFLSYSQKFYDPLRILGTIIGNIQSALASWVRISDILQLENNLKVLANPQKSSVPAVMQFEHVSFGYDPEKVIIYDASFSLLPSKTYALVGPTGGGKSTMASLMTRLYDPQKGAVFFQGKDIRSYTFEELSVHIGFILQDALLFSGTIGENIRYGNPALVNQDDKALLAMLKKEDLTECLDKFPDGLSTAVISGGENLSVGQKQLVSFMRVILRKPALLILDEATANIDTVTEQYLNQLLEKTAAQTTKVIIAHRLNTIKNADQIIFISNGHIQEAVDFKHALQMIDGAKRKS